MPRVVAMCIGDSITMGSSGYTGGWRRPLSNLAPNLVFVGRNCKDPTYGDSVGHHEGYGGAQTATFRTGGAAGDITIQVDAYAPALVLLMLGTNDVAGGKTPAQALIDVLALAEDIKARASVQYVIISNICPRAVGDPDYTDTVDFRAGFEAAMAGRSSGISICDAPQTLVNPSADFVGGVHPSDAGYAKMAPYWYAAVQATGVQTQPDRVPVPRGDGSVWGYG